MTLLVDHSNDPYFEKAIAEGSGEFKHVIFIMHGPPGSGKTSVQRLMLGEPPLPEEEQQSTGIVYNNTIIIQSCT